MSDIKPKQYQRGEYHNAVEQIERHGQLRRATAHAAKNVIDDAERQTEQSRQQKLRRLRCDRKIQRHPQIRPNSPRRCGASSS